jgi:hypothetical protein
VGETETFIPSINIYFVEFSNIKSTESLGCLSWLPLLLVANSYIQRDFFHHFKMRSLFLSTALLLPALVASQLSGTVGPLTSRAAKAAVKVCNILDYGGVASATTDNSAAILDAWAACIDGGESWSIHMQFCFPADSEKSTFHLEAMDSPLGSL